MKIVEDSAKIVFAPYESMAPAGAYRSPNFTHAFARFRRLTDIAFTYARILWSYMPLTGICLRNSEAFARRAPVPP
jgi:hypothetical protein